MSNWDDPPKLTETALSLTRNDKRDSKVSLFQDRSKCPFCGEAYPILFQEHYRFCTSCTAIWSYQIVMKGCKHLHFQTPAIVIERDPWYAPCRENFKVPHPVDSEVEQGSIDYQSCSVCGKEVIVDGF